MTGQTNTLKEEGLRHFRNGMYPEALDAFEQARNVYFMAGDRLNEAQIVTIPGQILVELGFDLRERMTTRYKFIFGCTNDDLVYIVPPELFGSLRGKEEGIINLGPQTWPVLAEAIPTF